MLCNKYAEGGGRFNYLRFCDAIDKGERTAGRLQAWWAAPQRPCLVASLTWRLRFSAAVFAAKGLEKRPEATPKSPLRGSTLRASFGRLPVRTSWVAAGVHAGLTRRALYPQLAEDPELLALLRRARVFVRTHGVVVKEFFRDFDKLNTGIVTKQQFRRELERCFAGAGFSERVRCQAPCPHRRSSPPHAHRPQTTPGLLLA